MRRTPALLSALTRRTARSSVPTLNLARAMSTKVSSSGPPHPFESFLNGSSGGYIEDMYHAWKESPESVHVSWQSVFARLDAGAAPGQSFVPPPSINAGASLSTAVVPEGNVSLAPAGDMMQTKVLQLIHAYQARGHNVADLDPLGIYDADLDGSTPPDLELANYGFTEADMDKEVNLNGLLQSGFIGAVGPMKLRDVISRLTETYASSIGVEYMHIWDHEQALARARRPQPQSPCHRLSSAYPSTFFCHRRCLLTTPSPGAPSPRSTPRAAGQLDPRAD